MQSRYISQKPFSEELAAVQATNRLWGFIDMNEDEIIPCVYNAVRDFHEGFAGVFDGQACGFINKTGELVIPCTYKTQISRTNHSEHWWGVRDFYEGLAPVCKEKTVFGGGYRYPVEEDFWGYIDIDGHEVIECKYYYVEAFKNGKAIVSTGLSEKGIIDQNGDMITLCQYSVIEPFQEGLAKVNIGYHGHKYGYINENGNEIVPCTYFDASSFSEGLGVVFDEWKGGKGDLRIIDTKGNTVLHSTEYSDAQIFSEGLLAVKNQHKKWGYIDINGVVMIPFKYDYAQKFTNEMARVSLAGINGLIDKKGRAIVFHNEVELHIPLDIVGEFNGNYALINNEGKYGLINTAGTFVVSPKFDYIGHLVNDMLIVGIGGVWDNENVWRADRHYTKGKYGIVHIDGTTVSPCIYDYISGCDQVFFRARLNNDFFFINSNQKKKKYKHSDWICLNNNNKTKTLEYICSQKKKLINFLSHEQLNFLIKEYLIDPQGHFLELCNDLISEYVNTVDIIEIINAYKIIVNAGCTAWPGERSDDAWIELISVTGDKRPHYYTHDQSISVYDYKGDTYIMQLLPFFLKSIWKDHHYSAGHEFRKEYSEENKTKLEEEAISMTILYQNKARETYDLTKHRNHLYMYIREEIKMALVKIEVDILEKEINRGIDYRVIMKWHESK